MMKPHRFLLPWIFMLSLAACSPEDGVDRSGMKHNPVMADMSSIGLDFDKVRKGRTLFKQYCAQCHGANAEGKASWRRKGPDGKWPALPLNGTGHGWHHPYPALLSFIRQGSDPGTGNIPGWKNVLTDEQISSIIAWFQSQWPDQAWQAWKNNTHHLQGG